MRGLAKRQQVGALAQWRAQMEGLEILPIDWAVGDLAGELYHRLVLVSANVRHYARVVEVGYPLRIVNWREEE